MRGGDISVLELAWEAAVTAVPADYLLGVYAEECCEGAHAASKARRFGPLDCKPGTTIPNRIQIAIELGEQLAIVDMLRAAGIDIPQGTIDQCRKLKPEKVTKFYEMYRDRKAGWP
jgi:hypothetical protein